MFPRLLALGRAWFPLVGGAILSISSLLAISAEVRVELGADVLAQSRGANPMYGLCQEPCNQLAQFYCMTLNATCYYCSTQNFPILCPNHGGSGYNPGTSGNSCGTKYSSTCQLNQNGVLVCTAGTTTTMPCPLPPYPPTPQ